MSDEKARKIEAEYMLAKNSLRVIDGAIAPGRISARDYFAVFETIQQSKYPMRAEWLEAEVGVGSDYDFTLTSRFEGDEFGGEQVISEYMEWSGNYDTVVWLKREGTRNYYRHIRNMQTKKVKPDYREIE